MKVTIDLLPQWEPWVLVSVLGAEGLEEGPAESWRLRRKPCEIWDRVCGIKGDF